MDGEGGVGAALGKAEHGIAGDFVHETNAAAAHDAALVVEPDAWADIDVFRLFHLHVDEAGDAAAVLDGLFLQTALASLVTDRAVERVVDQEKLHHALTAFFHQLAVGADAHVLADRVCAGDHGARHPADGFEAVFIPLRLLAGGGARGHSHLHQTHPAVPRGAQFRVVAVMGDGNRGLPARLDHPRAFGELMPNAVDLDIDQAFRGSKVFRQFKFRSRRRCIAHGKMTAPKTSMKQVQRARSGICRADTNPASALCEKFHKQNSPAGCYRNIPREREQELGL